MLLQLRQWCNPAIKLGTTGLFGGTNGTYWGEGV